MLKLEKILVIFMCLLVLLSCFGTSLSQTTGRDEPANKDSIIKGENLNLALQGLSFYYKSPIGFEFAVGGFEPSQISADVAGKSFEAALDEILAQDARYTWIKTDEVVNVYPKENRDNLLKSFLETKVKDFSISERSTVLQVKQSLIKTPEVIELLKATNTEPFQTGFFSQDLRLIYALDGVRKRKFYSLQIPNATVREILNRLIKESGRQYWLVNRDAVTNDFWIGF
jgi:hypothetical protein